MSYYARNNIAYMMYRNAYDADAQAFINATGIADTNQKNAINKLVLSLKDKSLWNKLKALYPFVGGSSFSHKFNLKDTTKFQITWYGGITHNSKGIKGNGTTGYGDTGFNPSTELSLNNTCLSSYIINNETAGYDIGVINGTDYFALNSRSGTNLIVSQQYDNNALQGRLNGSTSDSSGLNLSNRTSSSIHRLLKEGSLLASATTSGGSLPNYNFFILAGNSSGAATGYTTRQSAFISIGEGLSTTNESDLYNAVLQFQTTLGRNV